MKFVGGEGLLEDVEIDDADGAALIGERQAAEQFEVLVGEFAVGEPFIEAVEAEAKRIAMNVVRLRVIENGVDLLACRSAQVAEQFHRRMDRHSAGADLPMRGIEQALANRLGDLHRTKEIFHLAGSELLESPRQRFQTPRTVG